MISLTKFSSPTLHRRSSSSSFSSRVHEAADVSDEGNLPSPTSSSSSRLTATSLFLSHHHRAHHHSKFTLILYIKLLAIFLTLFIDQVYGDDSNSIDRKNEAVIADIRDLNEKIASSEKVLLKLLSNPDVQSASDLKEHVEKMLDYLRFRRDGINTWKINKQQFEIMKNGINKDYAALPFKIVHILSQASKNKIIHVVPYTT